MPPKPPKITGGKTLSVLLLIFETPTRNIPEVVRDTKKRTEAMPCKLLACCSLSFFFCVCVCPKTVFRQQRTAAQDHPSQALVG